MNDPDLRRHPRFLATDIQASLESPQDCRVINLSSSGICFETRRQLNVGDHQFLEVQFQGMTASLEIVVKWRAARPTVDYEDPASRGVVRAGASFVAIERDSPSGFWDVIDVYPDIDEASAF